jgi:hypothetical protein
MPDAQIDWSLDNRLRRPKKDIPSDRERDHSTGRIIQAVRVQEGRDDLFLIRAGTPSEVQRERVQRSFKKAVRLYEKGILPSSAMRTQMRMAKYLDDEQLAALREICNLPHEWLENQQWLNRSLPQAV